MPFMGKDWRSPGEAWVKTETLGWQRMKIIESQLHPSCRQSPACSWPPKSEFGSHMANNCGKNRVVGYRDSLSSGDDDNSSGESSRAGSQSPSPTSTPEKNQQNEQNLLNHNHHHHLHPITISSPYGKYSCCAHHIELARTSPNYYSIMKANSSHQQNAQLLISRSLSKESVTINNNGELQPKMRYNNSVSDFRTTSSINNEQNQFYNNNNAETSASQNWDKIIVNDNNTNLYSDNSKISKPILMKNGTTIQDIEDKLQGSFNTKSMESINTNDNNNIKFNNNNNKFNKTIIGKNCCCNLNNPYNPQQPYVRTAPHCRISVRTREVAMYNTISEAFYRLDFCNAIHDIRRFNYICKLLHLLITQNLTSLSGCATKVLFTMLEQVAWEVSENKRNIHVLKNLLNELKNMIKKYYCWGRPIGSSLLWQQHFDTIERISQIVDGIELSPPKNENVQTTFNDLPVEMIREILLRLNDYRDLINSAQASPVMRTMIDGQHIWRQLCKYHFTENQLKLAIEHNYLFTKRGNVRRLKYARTASADGKTSFRNPVIHKTKCNNLNNNNNNDDDNIISNSNSTKEQLELTKGRRCSRSKESKLDDSSYVTRAIKIFDNQGSSTTLGSTKIRMNTPDSMASRREKANNNNNNLQSLNSKSQQQQQQEVVEENSSLNSNQTSNEIDWERIFHQLRKKFDLKEEYADCLLLCRHCRCLFWKSFGHPCIKGDESSSITSEQTLHNPRSLCENHNLRASSNQSNNNSSDTLRSSSIGIDGQQRNTIQLEQQNHRPSVAILSRNFDTITHRPDNRENLPPIGLNQQQQPQPRPSSSSMVDSTSSSSVNSGNPLNIPLRERNAEIRAAAAIVGNPRLVDRNRDDNNGRKRNELVPKHVAISPQAFLKFFSL